MILPDKHIKLSESILGLGGVLVKLLNHDYFVDELWKKFEKINNSPEMPTNHTYDNFLLTLDFLFLIGAVNVNNDGRLYLCN